MGKIKIVDNEAAYNYGLYIILLLTLLLTYIPYSIHANPNQTEFGVDIPYYLEGTRLTLENYSNAFIYLSGSRPIVFLLFALIHKLTQIPINLIIKYSPFIFNVLYVLSIYYFTFELFQSKKISTWSCFFTICGTFISVGMYSYFLANNLGLVLITLSITYLFKYNKQNNLIYFLVSILLCSAVLFIHPWTFNQYYYTFILYVIYNKYISKSNNGKYLAHIIIITLIIGIKQAFVIGTTSYEANTRLIDHFIIGSQYWINNITLTTYIYGGAFGNSLYFILSFLGLILIKKYIDDNQEIRYLYLLSICSTLPLLFQDFIVQSRILYNIPMGIFSAITFLEINSRNQSVWRLLSIYIVAYSLSYTIQFLMNIV